MNYKIPAIIFLAIVFTAAFILLNAGLQSDTDKNNTHQIKNNNDTDSTLIKDNNKPKNFSAPSEIKDSSINDYNFSSTAGKIYKYTLTELREHNVTNVMIYSKGIEEINGSEYIVSESKIQPPQEYLNFHISKMPESILRKNIITNCPPECEKADDTGYYWNTIEYIDIKTGHVKITAVPWSPHYKIENKTVYEKFELVPDSAIVYKYNFTDYSTYPEELMKIFTDISELHPLYLPGFIDFKTLNITAEKDETFISTKCSKDKIIVDYIPEPVYNCTSEYNVEYIRKTDNKILINNSYTKNEEFYSSEMPGKNEGKQGEQHVSENLSWAEIEGISGNKEYKIEYLIITRPFAKIDENDITTSAEKFTIWIDKDDKILLGAKWEEKMTGGFITHLDYKLIDEQYSYCGDKICDLNNKESSQTCCKDCLCREGEECRGDFCMMKKGDYFIYKDEIFNYSISASDDFYGRKFSSSKILFYSRNETKEECTLDLQIIPNENAGGQYISAEDVKKAIFEQMGDYENQTEEKIKINDLNADEISASFYDMNEKIKRTAGIIKKGDYFYIITYTSTQEHYNSAYRDYKNMVESLKFF